MIHKLPLQNQIILAQRQLRKQYEELERALLWMCMALDEEWARGRERSVEEMFEFLDAHDGGNAFLEPDRKAKRSSSPESHLRGWSQNVAGQLHDMARASSELAMSLSRAATSLMIAASPK